MAKYEDYVKKDDALDDEIEDAASGTATRQSDDDAAIPERFKGKSAADIARSYAELETMSSRQAQDLGQMRRMADELLSLKLPSEVQSKGQPSKQSLTTEEIVDNPDEAIRRVVKEESGDRIAQLEQELQQERNTRAMATFNTSYPTWQDDVKSPEMLNWIKEKPYRVRLAMAADRGDLDAAADLFGSYYDARPKAKTPEEKQAKKKRVLDASLETSGAGVPDTVETYSRSDLMTKRIAAKRGDSVAERWLASRDASIRQAYAEGRVID